MIDRFVLAACLCSMIGGCASTDHAPISMDAARTIKSGTPLADIAKILGEPHAPTALQAAHLQDVVLKMPGPMQTNAAKDQSLAWGNDSGFLAVKVNDEGIAWVTALRSGGS